MCICHGCDCGQPPPSTRLASTLEFCPPGRRDTPEEAEKYQKATDSENIQCVPSEDFSVQQ